MNSTSSTTTGTTTGTINHDTLHTCRTDDLPWVWWAMRGSQFKLLSADRDSGHFTLLIKVSPGVTAPLHRHIGAVEAYVLDGSFHYSDDPTIRFTAGSYLMEKAGAVHQPVSPDGALMLAHFHGPVEGLDDAGNVSGRIDWRWHVDAWNAAGGDYQV